MATLLPAAVEGRWIRLRPVSRSDHPDIFAQRIDARSLHLNGLSVAVPTFEDWEATELRQMLGGGPAMVVEQRDGSFLGLLHLHKMNLHDGWGYAEFRLPLDIGEPLIETSVAFLDYAFSYFNFRKLYVETIALHLPLIEWLQRLEFQEEVRLKEYVWHAGEYVDLIHVSLQRLAWEEIRRRFVTSLDVAWAASSLQK